MTSTLSRISVALGVLVVGNLLLAPPAGAEPASPVTITHKVECDRTTGAVTVDYTVNNVSSETVTAVLTGSGPRGGTVDGGIGGEREILVGGRHTYVETVPPTSAKAWIDLTVRAGSGPAQQIRDLPLYSCSSAHATTISGTATCDPETGGATVVWTTATKTENFSDPADVQFDVVAFQPSAPQSTVDPMTATIRNAPGLPVGSARFTQKIAPGQGVATLTLQARLAVDVPEDEGTNITSVGVALDCGGPAPTPTATGGVGSPGLPVTGTSVWPFVAGGATLLAIGVALVAIVRRRRLTFTS